MKTHQRTTPWFGKYDHRIKVYLPECSALRSLDHARIDKIIQSRKDWGERTQRAHPGSWSRSWVKTVITDQQVENLHEFCDFLLNDTRRRKLVISGDTLYLYTDDPSMLQDIQYLKGMQGKYCTMEQVELIGQPNTVRLRTVNHQLRSFFKTTRLDANSKLSLKNFLDAQEDVRVSRALRDALDSSKTLWLFSYYFIDHDETSILTMLNMLLPKSIRLTLPIVADK